MAKKQTFTTDSKNNMKSRLQQLRSEVYSPSTELPTSEEVKVGELYTEPLPVNQESQIISPVADTKDSSDVSKNILDTGNLILDPVFSFVNGIQQDMVDRPTGQMLLNNKELGDLEFQKQFLENEIEMKDLDQKLNQAYLSRDQERVKELYPQYKATLDAYTSMFDEYTNTASKYYNEYGKQKTARERLAALEQGIKSKNDENKQLGESVQFARDVIHNTNKIYSPSEYWKQQEQQDWTYQIPRALGTSVSSLQATAVNMAAAAASNYVIAQVAASPAGPYSPFIAGGAAILGAGTTVATNIWSRNRESLSEVSNNYKQNLYQYANDNNIDINDIANQGRQTLEKITGNKYSEDKNSPDYRSNDEVFEDMLAYDIPTNNSEINSVSYKTKKNLKDIYNRNMALAASDIAEAVTIIPGAGKVFTKVLGKLNLPERAIDGTVKILDKAVEYTTKKVAPNLSKAAKNRLSKYIIDPVVRISAGSLMEGAEEVTQFMIGENINADKNIQDMDLYNPFDVTKMFLENNILALKGLAAVAGVSGNPALNNNKELVDNFKVGAAIGLLMGGTTQTAHAANNVRSYNAGLELSRQLMAEDIKTKEDVYKYTQYAEKANKKMLNRDAFIDAIDQQINENAIPDGWTKEDLELEKQNIFEIYDIVNNNQTIKKVAREDRATSAALIKQARDTFNSYQESYRELLNNREVFNNVIKDVNDLMQLNNIPQETIGIVNEYLITKAQAEGLDKYINTLQQLDNINIIDELFIKQADLKSRLNILSSTIKDNNINEDITLPTQNDEIAKDYINKIVSEKAVNDAKSYLYKLQSDPNYLQESVNKYKDTLKESKQEEDTEQLVEANEQYDQANLDQEAVEDVAITEEPTQEQPEVVVQQEEEQKVEEPVAKKEEKPNILTFADFDSSEDYSGITEEELSENDLIEETKSAQSTGQELENNMQEEFSNNAQQQIPTTIEDTIPEQSTFDAETTEVQDKSSQISEQDIKDSEIYDTDGVIEEATTELVYGTLYYQFTDTPMFEGYESGNALNQYLSTPGNLSNSKVTAKVGKPTSKFGAYDPSNKATWDNAAIYIEITSNDGKKYIATLKTIEGAKSLYLKEGNSLSQKEEDNIRSLRNTIIEAKINDPDCEITFKNINITNGSLNNNRTDEGKVINRPLTEIKGLNIPTNLHELYNSNIKFGIGKGIADHFIIMDQNGLPLSGKGGSGRIFIYPDAKDTPAGVTRNIQVNNARFSNPDGTPSDLAQYLADVLIYRTTNNPNIYPDDILKLVLWHSESTVLDPSDKRYSFLADKQFFINYKEGYAQLGRETVTLDRLRTDVGKSELVEFISDNLNWSVEKNLLWQPLPKGFKEALLDTNEDSFELVNGLVFDLEDVGLIREDGKLKDDPEHPDGLSTLAWMIKHGKLQSDLKDQIFTKPFVYIDEPVITSKPKQEVQKINKETKEPTKKKFSLMSVPTFDQVEETKTDVQQKKEEYDQFTDANSDAVQEFFGLDGAPKIGSIKEFDKAKLINTKKAVKWLKDNLGLEDAQIEVVDGVLKQFANGSAVYGIARADSIAISNQALEGVQYHEAWHRVSLLMLDKETRQKLYKEFKYQNKKYNNLNDQQLEEVIADRFMDYMLNDKESTLRYYINKIFRNIKKFIGINTNINPSNLNTIFDAIKYGDFSKYQLDEDSVNAFTKQYQGEAYYKVGPNKDIVLKHFPNRWDFDSALDSLKACMFISNGAKYLSDINNLQDSKLRAFLESFIKSNHTTTEQKEALQEILDNFDVFMYHLKPLLQQMGIRRIDEESDVDFQDREQSGIQNYDKASYEFDKKNNALASAKMFIATLADTYFSYKDVSGVKTRQLNTRVNTITGLPMIVNYDTAAALILKNLSTVETYSTGPGQNPETSLLGRCARLSKGNPFFAFLYKRLNGSIDINLQTQLLQTIKSFDQNFVEVHYNKDEKGNASFSIDDGINKRSTKMYPSTWSDLFFNSSMINRTNDEIKPNATEINNVITEFDNLYNQVNNSSNLTSTDVDSHIINLVNIFNKIGITIDSDTIEGMLGADRVRDFKSMILNNKTGALKYLFTDTLYSIANNKQKAYKQKGVATVRQLDRIYMSMGRDNFITALAHAQAITHPDDTEISVLGPNNNIIYTKTLNCFVSDQVRWLNNHDEAVIKDLNSDTYCQGSLILSAVNNNSQIKLNTFVNFYGDNSGDKGRDYLSISPVEDYLAKMTFTYNNHIIFPTMADKKTWFTISGVGLFNKELFITQSEDQLKLQFDKSALKQLYKYWEAEYNTITKYYESLQDIKNPIKNYHTSGKGGLFRHFTGYYLLKNGVPVWMDLNARLKDAAKEGNISQVLSDIKQELFNTPVDTYKIINNNLHMQLKQELETCEKLGIIEKDKRDPKILRNKLLDNAVYNHYKDIYTNNANLNISKNADKYTIMTMIGNHMINTNISVIETEKIFTGDVAFYKNDDDKIKRLGAVLSTGDNLRTQWLTNDPNKIQEYRALQNRQNYTSTTVNDNEIPSRQHKQLEQMFVYSTTRDLLIEKEGLTESEVDELMKDQKSAEQKYPVVFQLARDLAIEDASAYGMNSKGTKGNINHADAAVYLRPQMYKDVVKMLGEWSDEVEEAFNIMESDQDWLNDPVLYAKSLKTLIKPLKTTYFGYSYDAKLQHCIPIFNKMAMFPLFKVLATGDNRELYNRMNAIENYKGETPIDQIAFESAVKVGIQGSTDVYKDYTNTEINDLKNMKLTTQKFRNLRRQLITDPHTHDRTLFGTQVSTVAVSNLVMDRVYQEGTDNQITGNEIKDQLFGTINAISNKGYAEVKQMFLNDENQLDYEKTSKQLIREAQASNLGKDIEEALELNESKTDFKVPLAALPDSKWVETKLISINNKKAIDLELPGGAFIQMSSFGFKSIKPVGSRAINNGKPLLNINDDGSMDSIISINLFSHIIPNYEKLSFIQAKDWLIEHNIIGESASPMAIGYRIPTQGLSSIAGLRIIDVLPSVVGDTIILPDEFTTQTGSDFDIDKLYIARYNYDKQGNKIQFIKQNKQEDFEQYLTRRYKEEMQPTEGEDIDANNLLFNRWRSSLGNDVYSANSREANENLLLDTYLSVLTDKKNVGETRLPLDKVTGIIKNEILPIVDGKSKVSQIIPYRELSPTYQMNKKYEYAGGKTGIGPFALNNKNHVLTQLSKLKFADIQLLKELGFTGLDGIKSRNENVYVRNAKGNIQLDDNGKQQYQLEEGLRILDWISAMINAHVDVAKDPYVIRLNVKQYTYNICNFLLRVGYGKSTFYFLPQQILKEMSDAHDKASGIYGVDDSSSKSALIKDGISKIRKAYYDKYKQAARRLNIKPELEVNKRGDLTLYDNKSDKVKVLPLHEIAKGLTERDFLIQQLQYGQDIDNLTDEQLVDYYASQLKISELFLQLDELAQDMSKLVQLSQVDTKRFGGNFIEQDRFLYRLKSLKANSVLFKAEDIQRYLDETFLNTKISNGIIGPSEMFKDIMVRGKQSFKDAISSILSMTNRIDTNDEALNKSISNELEGILRYGFFNSKDIDLFGMLYGNQSMAKRLASIKSDILQGKYSDMLTQDGKIANQLLNYLGTLTKMSTDKYTAPDIITKNRISDDDKFLKNNLIQYWEELLESPHSEIKQFAEDLIYYQLATTGGNNTKNGIFNLLPISAIQNTGYADYMRGIVEGFNPSAIDYDNLFLNNWKNNKIVKTAVLTKKEYVQETDSIEDVSLFPVLYSEQLLPTVNKSFPIVMIPNYKPVGRNIQKQNVYIPYVKVKIASGNNPASTILYKYIGNVIGEGGEERPVYCVVNKKGLNQEGRTVKEYDNYSNSIFEFNNIDIALNAKTPIFANQVNELLQKGRSRDIQKWSKLLNNLEIVQDYSPTTVALRSNIRDINEYTKQENPIQVDPITKPINESSSTFTFNDGTILDIPFKLNQQQEHALLTLEDFFNNPNKYDNNITLTGYAGTGKTTIISIFDKYLSKKYSVPVYSAPTHRANAVTKMNNPLAQVLTLHSAFGLSPMVDFDNGKYDLKKLKTQQLRKPKLEPNSILIIDEASMVNKGLYDFIQDFKNNYGVKVIYVGDPAQLSPVSDNGISPVFQNRTTQVELTKVERTGDNPILEEATALRSGKDLSFTTKLVNNEGVEYTNDKDRASEIIKNIVSSTEYQNNPLYFRILSATNQIIPEVNNQVRKQLYGEDAKQIEVGELLMGYENINIDSADGSVEIIRNSIDYVVTSTSDKISNTIQLRSGNKQVFGYNVQLKNAMTDEIIPENIFILDSNTDNQTLQEISDTIEELNRDIDNMFKTKQYGKISNKQKQLASLKYNTILLKDFKVNNATRIRKALDYGYTHTIHKSQGGTYNKVMIYADTISEARFDEATQQQLKYVAVSRAKQNVYILTKSQINNKIESSDYISSDETINKLAELGKQRKIDCNNG